MMFRFLKIDVEDVVLLAVGYNLRYLFACHHKKNVIHQANPEVPGFNGGRHRRLTNQFEGCGFGL